MKRSIHLISSPLLSDFKDSDPPSVRAWHASHRTSKDGVRPAPKHHIYQQYFTPSERRKLDALPDNDVTPEIELLRYLLAQAFAQVPRAPADIKNNPLSIRFFIELLTTFSRVAMVIGGLFNLQKKMHNLRDEVRTMILEAIHELDPYKEL